MTNGLSHTLWLLRYWYIACQHERYCDPIVSGVNFCQKIVYWKWIVNWSKCKILMIYCSMTSDVEATVKIKIQAVIAINQKESLSKRRHFWQEGRLSPSLVIYNGTICFRLARNVTCLSSLISRMLLYDCWIVGENHWAVQIMFFIHFARQC